MALVLGTNCGFCVSAPSADPGGSIGQIDGFGIVFKDTSPGTAAKIVEIGVWIDNATEEANIEFGLYAADGVVVPGEAGTRLFVDTVNAKGTTAGWKSKVVDWSISASTAYWLAVQCDDVVTATNTDSAASGGAGFDTRSALGALPDPFGGGALLDADGLISLYVVWEAAAAGGDWAVKFAGEGGGFAGTRAGFAG